MKFVDKNIFIADLLFKRFTSSLSEQEEEALNVWLQDPDNRDYLELLEQPDFLFEDMGEMLQVDTKEAYNNVTSYVSSRKRAKIIRIVTVAAASVILLIFLPMFLLKQQPTHEFAHTPVVPAISLQPENAMLTKWNGDVIMLADSVKSIQISEEKGLFHAPSFQKREEINKLQTFKKGKINVVLADGTKVWLNAETVFEYPNTFEGSERVVKLEGEAFFEVTKDTRRPFIVQSGGMSIRVLGTSFNVNSQADEGCVATLVEGRISVKNNYADSVVINQGQQVALSNEGYLNVRNVDTFYYTAWLTDYFAFKNTELASIISTVAKWYDLDYYIESKSLEKTKYTSTVYRYENVQDVLNLFNSMSEFNCQIIGQSIVVTAK